MIKKVKKYVSKLPKTKIDLLCFSLANIRDFELFFHLLLVKNNQNGGKSSLTFISMWKILEIHLHQHLAALFKQIFSRLWIFLQSPPEIVLKHVFAFFCVFFLGYARLWEFLSTNPALSQGYHLIIKKWHLCKNDKEASELCFCILFVY